MSPRCQGISGGVSWQALADRAARGGDDARRFLVWRNRPGSASLATPAGRSGRTLTPTRAYRIGEALSAQDRTPGPAGIGPGPAGNREGASDEALMLCVKAGELGCLQDLISRHERGLFGFLARFTGDSHLAEDLFQETFLRVVEKREAFDPARGFRPWLYAIAANLARDACRRREVRSRDAGSAGGSASAAPARPDDELERREEAALVRRSVEELPEDAKAMVLLHFYQGFRYREIAETFGVPVGTVKSRIHWAVERLAAAWREGSERALAAARAARRGGSQ